MEPPAVELPAGKLPASSCVTPFGADTMQYGLRGIQPAGRRLNPALPQKGGAVPAPPSRISSACKPLKEAVFRLYATIRGKSLDLSVGWDGEGVENSRAQPKELDFRRKMSTIKRPVKIPWGGTLEVYANRGERGYHERRDSPALARAGGLFTGCSRALPTRPHKEQSVRTSGSTGGKRIFQDCNDNRSSVILGFEMQLPLPGGGGQCCRLDVSPAKLVPAQAGSWGPEGIEIPGFPLSRK